jgi:hypothetical protein
MFKRAPHQAIATVLQALDADFLEEAACFFGGGTAITLLLGEYLESVDIDFLCASQDGYRLLRNRIVEQIAPIFTQSIQQVGHVRRDQYGIRTRVAVGASTIKFEIIRGGANFTVRHAPRACRGAGLANSPVLITRNISDLGYCCWTIAERSVSLCFFWRKRLND